jgi:hypothetical protein
MPFMSQRSKLDLTTEEVNKLEKIIHSRTESVSHIERAKMLLFYHKGETIASIARILETNRAKVERHMVYSHQLFLDLFLIVLTLVLKFISHSPDGFYIFRI